jgi:hypothetical protein
MPASVRLADSSSLTISPSAAACFATLFVRLQPRYEPGLMPDFNWLPLDKLTGPTDGLLIIRTFDDARRR